MTVTQVGITLIVRECGERTADACASLLTGYFPGHTVHRVSGRPFHATLQRSLALGLREGRPWTLCIDADVLALPSIVAFVESASRLPQRAFGIQALVLDKLLRAKRPAGNHLYRTEFIATALPYIPTEGALRPETAMIDAMARIGFPFHQSLDIVGLHDYEQYLQDIYAKAYLHGHKHRYLANIFKPLWQALAELDVDYRVALAALDDALISMDAPVVGRGHTSAMERTAIERLGIAERTAFGTATTESVQRMLEAGQAPPGEVGTLQAELQQMIDVDLDAQEKARLGQTAAGQQNTSSLIRLLKNVLSRTMRN